MKLDRFFDAAARARVAEAVKAAESRTSAQIVPVVVERSGDYHRFLRPLSYSFVVTWGALGLSVFVPSLHLTPLNVFAGSALIALMALLAAVGPPLAGVLGRDAEAAVRQRAMVAFVEHGVYRTREENGVLLFASIYERKVVVLGDRAAHAKLGDEHWKRAVDALVAGIKGGDPAAGFCTAIADIGEELALAFPRGAESQSNELSDELRIER